MRWRPRTNIIIIIIIIIIRSRRQQRSIASTQSGHDDEPWTIQHKCWRVYVCQSAGSMNGAGVLAVAANQDQNGGQFLLLRPVIMRSGLACGHRVSPHGQTMNFVSWRWHPEHREGWSGRQLLCFWQSHASTNKNQHPWHMVINIYCYHYMLPPLIYSYFSTGHFLERNAAFTGTLFNHIYQPSSNRLGRVSHRSSEQNFLALLE